MKQQTDRDPDFQNIGLFKTPLVTLCTLAIIVHQTSKLVLIYCYKQTLKISIMVLFVLAFAMLDGPHAAYR